MDDDADQKDLAELFGPYHGFRPVREKDSAEEADNPWLHLAAVIPGQREAGKHAKPDYPGSEAKLPDPEDMSRN